MRRLEGSNPSAPAKSRRGGRADNCTSLLMRSRATSSTVGSNPTPSAEYTEACRSGLSGCVGNAESGGKLDHGFESHCFRWK